MNIYKYTVISALFLATITILLLILPLHIILTVVASFVLISIGNSILHNYDIDFKYWFSFIAQLLGFIFIVGSFISLLVVGLNYLPQ
jgi:hypothetical protein